MEKKFVRVPFDVEMAKRISDGGVDGRIVTRDGRDVRIICYDRKEGSYPIVGLIKNKDWENLEEFTIKGEWGEDEADNRDLFLYVSQNDEDLSNVEGNGKKYELKPFDKVLCRDHDTDIWWADFFLTYDERRKVSLYWLNLEILHPLQRPHRPPRRHNR